MVDLNSPNDLERLEEQIFSYKPNIKTTVQKKNVSNRLRNQLLESKAVVRIQRMDTECENLVISLKQRVMLLQENLIPKDNGLYQSSTQKVFNYEDKRKSYLSSDSSDDETLSTLMLKQGIHVNQKMKTYQKSKTKTLDMQQADTSASVDSDLPLALRKKPRERRSSYKSYSSASTSHSNTNRIKLHMKQEHTVTTSGVDFHSEDILAEQEEADTTPTLHIKIPSLHRGNVHYIILDSLNFGRKVFDYRANEIKQQQQQKSISHNYKISKSRNKQINCSGAPVLQQLTQHEQDLEQLIQDVIAEASNDETLQATSALENINKNLVDNYDAIAHDTVITYSQSSQELSCSQNSNVINDMLGSSLPKKTRKYTKRTNEHKLNEPPKKRGRKPRKKNDAGSEKIQPQPPTKSNLAKYVEFFSNDCDLLPGSSTPAASSTRSLPLVSSTTHNFEVVDQLPQQREQQAQQPITYYIDGDWANGGPCQLVSTNGVSVDGRQLNQDVNGQFHDFVNYIDNNGDLGSNVIANGLECNNSLPISIPLPRANLELENHNKNHYQVLHQTHHLSTVVQNSAVPIINIQIPTLPNNIINAPAPKPAHTHKEVLDLSLKSSINVNSTETLSINLKPSNGLQTFSLTGDDDCLPLDLSVKGCYTKENLTENNCVTIDTQDEDFIRCLIEQSDFNYSPQKFRKRGSSGENLTYDAENTKSFEAALDMPLLDFDATNLEQLAAVDQAVTTSNNIEKSLTDKMVYNDFTNNEDSNYVSMTTAVNSTVGNQLGFSDQSTTEIFNKLLDICPDNQFLTDINHELIANDDDLNEIDFGRCKVGNSTMCENDESPKVQKYQEEKAEEEEKEQNNQETDDNSIVEPSSFSSLAVQLDSSNHNADMSVELSLNSNFSESNDSHMLKTAKIIQTKSFKNTENDEKDNEIYNSAQQALMENKEKEKVIETTSKNYQDANNMCLSLDKEIVTEIENNVNNKKDEENLTRTENSKLENKKNIDDHDQYLRDSANIDTSTTNTNTQNANNAENTKITDKNNQDTSNTLLSNTKYDNAVHLMELSTVKSKHKENVVFSVPKIRLSEDDNLYITDSDSSSGKSYYLDRFKSIDTDAKKNKKSYFSSNLTTRKNNNDKEAQSDNIEHVNSPDSQHEISDQIVEQNINDLTDVETKNAEISSTEKLNLSTFCKEEIESVRSDVNIYNKVEKLQNVKQETNVISNNSECTNTNVQTLKYENRNIMNSSENLTLLELECKLENSLDFDEDFDDALSLATSCFDSPNDERFEDSVVDVDISTAAHTTQDPDSQQNNSCPNLSPIKDLKHFKIPKLSSATKSPTKGEETQISNSTLPTDCGPKTVLPLNIEKITRTVKNDLVNLNTAAEVTLAANNLDEDEEITILENLILKVFGIGCLPFLVDKCFDIAHCKLSHQLYDPDKVYLNLNTMDKIQVNLAYRVLYNHSKLFKIYFEVFCAYYSTKNERCKLLNMVYDCERYPEYGGFMIAVYEALVKCGLSRVNACRLILKRIREQTMATTIVEALVAIIMKSDWTMFTDFIEKFTQDVYKYNFRIGILEQMAPAVLNSKSPHLKQVFGKCVQTLHCDDTGLLLNSPALIQCVSLLAANIS